MNERQWLLLNNGTEKMAFLRVYIACQSQKNDGYLKWNEDLFDLLSMEAIRLRAQGFVIFCLGDFNSRVGQIAGLKNNTPDTNNNTPMFINFINQVNLVIVNAFPIAKGLFTRFMDNTNRPGTESLLDYGLVDSEHVHTVTSFVIDSDARFDAGSDHALLIAKLEFGITSTVNWSLEKPVSLNFNSETDFSEYQTTGSYVILSSSSSV